MGSQEPPGSLSLKETAGLLPEPLSLLSVPCLHPSTRLMSTGSPAEGRHRSRRGLSPTAFLCSPPLWRCQGMPGAAVPLGCALT